MCHNKISQSRCLEYNVIAKILFKGEIPDEKIPTYTTRYTDKTRPSLPIYYSAMFLT